MENRVKLRFAKHALALGCVAIFLIWLGLDHHIRFFNDVGEWDYFKNAYDEDTYFIWFDQFSIDHYRWLSLLVYHISKLFITKTHIPMVFDAVLPVLFSTGIYVLSFNLGRSRILASFLSILTLVAPDILSFQNLAVATSSNMSSFVDDYPRLVYFVPDAVTTYFGFLRTFEPTVSWIYYVFLFSVLLNERNLVQNRLFSVSGWRRVALYVLCVLSPITYSFPFLAFFVFQLLWLTISLAYRRKDETIAVTVTLGLTLLSFLFFYNLSEKPNLGGTIYQSHLPFLSPSFFFFSLYLLAFLPVLAMDSFRRSLLLCFVLVSIVVLNQQVVTGVLVSVRDWEKYVCYFYPSIGLILFSGNVWAKSRINKMLLPKIMVGILTILLMIWLLSISDTSYKMWKSTNLTAYRFASAMTDSHLDLNRSVFLLDNPGLSANLRWRLDLEPENFVIDYTELFRKRIGLIEGNRPIDNQEYYKTKLFRYFALKQMSRKEIYDLLLKQANQQSGYEIAFLFGFRDFWYPATDHRQTSEGAILKRLPDLLSTYSPDSSAISPGNRSVYRITDTKLTSNNNWSFELIYVSTRLQLKPVYVYKQVPAKN